MISWPSFMQVLLTLKAMRFPRFWVQIFFFPI